MRNTFLFFVVLFTLAGCGGGGGGGGSTAQAGGNSNPPPENNPPPPENNPPPPANNPPTADAGPGQSVLAGKTVTLNGSGSDLDTGDTLTYKWTQSSGPDGGTFNDDTSVNAEFTTPALDNGELIELTLTVSDGTDTATATVEINVYADVVTCEVGPVPDGLDIPDFYGQYCDMNGIPVVASLNVVPEALVENVRIVSSFHSKRLDVYPRYVFAGVRFMVLAAQEGQTDPPEYADLNTQFPLENGETWNERARGVGATSFIPVSSVGEENLLCYNGDRFPGESIALHESAHTYMEIGLQNDPAYDGSRTDENADWLNRLNVAYDAAMDAGLWQRSYARRDVKEYFAQGFQIFFDGARPSFGSEDDAHGDNIMTREDLFNYNRVLYDLIVEVAPLIEISTCYSS